MEIGIELLEGFAHNLLITLLAALLPLGIGALLSFLASLGKVPAVICRWLSLPTESLCPPLLLFCLMYLPGMLLGMSLPFREAIVIVGLAICFVGYMPARYETEVSFAKNLVCNGLDLVSQLLKWSFVARMLAVAEMSLAAERYVAQGIVWPLIVALLLATVAIGVLEIGKRFAQTFMK